MVAGWHVILVQVLRVNERVCQGRDSTEGANNGIHQENDPFMCLRTSVWGPTSDLSIGKQAIVVVKAVGVLSFKAKNQLGESYDVKGEGKSSLKGEKEDDGVPSGGSSEEEIADSTIQIAKRLAVWFPYSIL